MKILLIIIFTLLFSNLILINAVESNNPIINIYSNEETKENSETDEDTAEGAGYFFAGLVALPVVLSLSISNLKYYEIYSLGFDGYTLGFCLASTIIGSLTVPSISVALLAYGIYSKDYMPASVFFSVMAGIYLINLIVGAALFGYIKYNPYFFNIFHTDFINNIFISSLALTSVFSVLTLVTWILFLVDTGSYSQAKLKYLRKRIKLNGLGFSIGIS